MLIFSYMHTVKLPAKDKKDTIFNSNLVLSYSPSSFTTKLEQN